MQDHTYCVYVPDVLGLYPAFEVGFPFPEAGLRLRTGPRPSYVTLLEQHTPRCRGASKPAAGLTPFRLRAHMLT